jgi:hypothetical protein
MNTAQQNESESQSIGEMLEADPGAAGARLAGVLASPFARPYPTQNPATTPAAGTAGELRGYYHKSDGSDRWKPSWSTFDHPRSGNTHKGVDIYAPVGTEVVAIADGYASLYPVAAPGDELGIKAGLTFTGSDGKKYDVLYGHLSAVNGVSRSVRKGEVLGRTGCTGNAEDGTCGTANSCGGHSSHLHVAVREPGGPYLDPVAMFNWTIGYAQDRRDVPCGQAFARKLQHHRSGLDESAATPSELAELARHAGPSKRYRRAFFSDLNSGDNEARVTIFENLVITLSVVAAGPYPGLLVSITGRERLLFHPALSPHSTYTITAAFDNLDADGHPAGAPVRVELAKIGAESVSDTGLRSLAIHAFVRGATLDLDKPVTFLGAVLDAL